ncbi:MAG: thioredoxin domain-containing protein [Polyangiaceae bacterium]|nr:thioredoxin domain-containing protein [Polyangiaceae bacterium]
MRLGAWAAALALALPACAAANKGGPAPAPEARATDALTVVPCELPGLATPVWDAHDPSIGPADAPVVMLVFSDFECPFCARVTGTILKAIEAFGDDLRVVFKHYPLGFHRRARPTAEAAAVAFAQGGALAFFQFHDGAFDHQDDLSRATYLALARAAGLTDLDAFTRALDRREGRAKVRADLDLGARLGVSGTPHTFINGQPISGARGFDEVSTVIRAELAATSGRGPAAACARMKQQVTLRPVVPSAGPERLRVALGDSPRRGRDDAKVTVTVFSDFQCTHCKEAEGPLAEVRRRYGDDVRLVWKDFPLSFHPMSRKAAWVAREARARGGDDAFFRAHALLFAASPGFDDPGLVKIAVELGVPEERARDVLANKIHDAEVQADVDQGDDLDVAGTPTLFLNGRKVVGVRQADELVDLIDDELDAVDALLARGVPRAGLYDELQRAARPPSLPQKKPLPPAPKDAPARGLASAPVSVEIFSDFQCKYCRRQLPALEELLAELPKQVKIVWRDRPLEHHEDALLAAEAAREARTQKGDAGCWRFHDEWFRGQKEKDSLKRPRLVELAREQGLDVARFERALDEHIHRRAIQEASEAAEKAGVTATPTVSIGGYVARGTQTIGQLRRLVARAQGEVAAAGAPSHAKGP